MNWFNIDKPTVTKLKHYPPVSSSSPRLLTPDHAHDHAHLLEASKSTTSGQTFQNKIRYYLHNFLIKNKLELLELNGTQECAGIKYFIEKVLK